MEPPLFVYGTLVFPEVFAAVTGRREAPLGPAVLPHHRRLRVRGESYPAVVPEEGATAEGVLYASDGALLATLDRFEGSFYERREVEALAGGKTRSAYAYVIAPVHRHRLTAEPWDPDRFLREDLADFLAASRRLVEGGREGPP